MTINEIKKVAWELAENINKFPQEEWQVKFNDTVKLLADNELAISYFGDVMGLYHKFVNGKITKLEAAAKVERYTKTYTEAGGGVGNKGLD